MPGAPYEADETGRIQRLGDTSGFELETHQLNADGQPRCGQRAKPWGDYTMRLKKLGPGVVTCKGCARVSGH
jgi:hypothetical protein